MQKNLRSGIRDGGFSFYAVCPFRLFSRPDEIRFGIRTGNQDGFLMELFSVLSGDRTNFFPGIGGRDDQDDLCAFLLCGI